MGLSKRLVTSAVYFEIAILAESKFGKKNEHYHGNLAPKHHQKKDKNIVGKTAKPENDSWKYSSGDEEIDQIREELKEVSTTRDNFAGLGVADDGDGILNKKQK